MDKHKLHNSSVFHIQNYYKLNVMISASNNAKHYIIKRYPEFHRHHSKYLCSPAQLRFQEAPQGKGRGPGNRGTPGQEPQSLCQLHPFLKGELHLHDHHGCSARFGGTRVSPGEKGKESDEPTRDDAVLCLRGKRRV